MSETPDLRAKILDYIRANPRCTSDQIYAGTWPCAGEVDKWSTDWRAHEFAVDRELRDLNTVRIVWDSGKGHVWIPMPSAAPRKERRADPGKGLERQRQKLLITIGAFAKLVPEHTAALAAMQDQIENMRPAPPKAQRKGNRQ